MIGMDFISFLILLVIALVVAIILHYLLGYYAVPGPGSFFGKLVLAWIGAWLGTPVFGHWWSGVNYNEVYIIPAILGSLALVVLAVDAVASFRGGAAEKPGAGGVGPTQPGM